MIDGTIARRTGTVSESGARLDTASDLIFMLVCSIKILPIVRLPLWLWAWIMLIALAKIFHFVYFFLRMKKLLSIHSVFNKILVS